MPFAVLKGADGVKLHHSKCLLQVSTILMIKTVCISVNFDLVGGELRLSPFPNKYTLYTTFLRRFAKPSRVARPPHSIHVSARVARGPRARAKNSIDAFWRFLCGGDHPVVQNPTKTTIRGHSRPRLADREEVLVAHPRPATPKIPPCTPNEFFAKQLPTTPPPDGVLRHIARQLPLIWPPAASHTPSRSPYKAHRSAAIWRKPAKKRTTQIALRRARRGGLSYGGSKASPEPPAAFSPSTTFPSEKSRARPCG